MEMLKDGAERSYKKYIFQKLAIFILGKTNHVGVYQPTPLPIYQNR